MNAPVSNILYLGHGALGSTSRHRADAIGRLGHAVHLEDPYTAFLGELRSPVAGAFHYRTGYRLLQAQVRTWAEELIRSDTAHACDLIWVDGGELLGRDAVAAFQTLGKPVVLYNIDDPTGARDGRRWDSLLRAIPVYSHCVVVRQESATEFLGWRARSVQRVWRSYDEIAHRPFDDATELPAQFVSDVAFVGTWIRGEGREKFLLKLIDHGLDVAIWGDRWHKAPSWKRLQRHWRGPALSGRDYVAAIQGSKIALGLLSHRNRDLHTTRSSEIPYAGGLLCAERTSEHTEMYQESEEAVFWRDAEECAAVCRRLLDNPELRERIRANGMRRARQAGYGNENVCRSILARVLGDEAPAAADFLA